MKRGLITAACILSFMITSCNSPGEAETLRGQAAESGQETTQESISSVSDTDNTAPEDSVPDHSTDSIISSLPTDVISDADTGTSLPTDVISDADTGASLPAESQETAGNESGNRREYTDSYLTPEVQEAVAQLETDYRKIYWGVEYSIPGVEGIVISITPCFPIENQQLIMGITNLYGNDVTINAEGYAMDASKNNIGDIHLYENAIRPGQTVIKNIYCSGVPGGAIHWSKFEVENVADESVYWESDWAFARDNEGFYKIPYQIVSDTNMQVGYIRALLLDERGYVIGCFEDYNYDKGTTVTGEINTYAKELEGAADIAFFANPLKAE